MKNSNQDNEKNSSKAETRLEANGVQSFAAEGLRLLESLRANVLAGEPAHLRSYFTEDQISELFELQRKLGIRTLPYPFSNAMALTNDLDKTNRDRFCSIQSDLVDNAGLDFGDSIWLATYTFGSNVNSSASAGLSFYNANFDFGAHAGNTHDSLWFYEILDQHHRGNIDHWHSFLSYGPRFSLVENLKILDGETAVYDFPTDRSSRIRYYNHFTSDSFVPLEFEFISRSGDFSIDFIKLIHRKGDAVHEAIIGNSEIRVDKKSVRSEGGEHTSLACEVLSVRDRVPPLDSLIRLEVKFDKLDSEDCVLVLKNHSNAILKDGLRSLAENYGVSTNLVTSHAFWHFYSNAALNQVIDRSQKEYEKGSDRVKTFHGLLEADGITHSVVADDPNSSAYIFDYMKNDLGITFLRLTQGIKYAVLQYGFHTGLDSCRFTEIVNPILGRDGEIFYNVSACFPKVDGTPNKTVAENFETRLKLVLDGLCAKDDTFEMFYTHLGNWIDLAKTSGNTDGEVSHHEQMNFGGASTRRLRDAHYSVPERLAEDKPIWFTRASVLANYALLMQTMPALVGSRSDNHIEIESILHPLLKQQYPKNEYQLYGATFEVADSIVASLHYNGRKIEDLVRVFDSQAGKHFITVASCGIRHVAVGTLDPKVISKSENSVWGFHSEQERGAEPKAFGTLKPAQVTQRVGETKCAVTFDISHLSTQACQCLLLSIRKSDSQAKFALRLTTENGGNFCFMEDGLSGAADDFGDATASYILPDIDSEPMQWTRYVVPFYLLDWKIGSCENLPLPNQSPKHLALYLWGSEKSSISIGGVEFGRPKTELPIGRESLLFIGGHVENFVCKRCVALKNLATGEIQRREADANQNGMFSFKEQLPGAYAIVSSMSIDSIDWEKAQLFDLATSRFDLVL